MTQAEQAAFVRRCYETAYEKQAQSAGAFLPGVPPEMRTGLTDGRGWFQWKLIPAPTRPEDLDALERKWGVSLPPLLRAFLSTDCHFLNTPGFFDVRPDDPLAVFRSTLAEPALFQAGLVPWAGERTRRAATPFTALTCPICPTRTAVPSSPWTTCPFPWTWTAAETGPPCWRFQSRRQKT